MTNKQRATKKYIIESHKNYTATKHELIMSFICQMGYVVFKGHNDNIFTWRDAMRFK